MFAIRRYRETDHAAVLAVVATAMEGCGGAGAAEDLRDVVRSYVELGGDFLVGTLQGRVVATGALRPRAGQETAEVVRLAVEPGFQGRGFGLRMLEALEERARREGAPAVRIRAEEGQTAALRLARRCGYAPVRDDAEDGSGTVLEKRLA